MARSARKTPSRSPLPRTRETAGFRWDERGKLIAAACACGALLLLALLLPLAFRSSAETQGAVSAARPAAEERAALFIAFWYGREGAAADGETVGPDESLAVDAVKSEPDAVTAAYCAERMAALTARCIDDRSLADPTPTGSEYTTVTGENGAEVHLCRMWLQARGDWQNWLDVCFDADNGCIYYLYVSRERLTNGSQYAGAARPDWASVAAALAESSGGRLRHFSGDASGGAAVIDTGEGVLCYQIKGAYYDALIDVRINCV